jgi:hypothetical protein
MESFQVENKTVKIIPIMKPLNISRRFQFIDSIPKLASPGRQHCKSIS